MTNVDPGHTSLNPIRPDDLEQVDIVQVDKEVVGQEGQGGDVEDRAEDKQDVRKPKPPTRPYPTKAEIYEHEVTHLPYRSWCKHCVHGKGASALTTNRMTSRRS